MATLATPNKNSYVVKKECMSRIVESKVPMATQKKIKENASFFEKNNLVKK